MTRKGLLVSLGREQFEPVIISSCWDPENRSIGSVRVLGQGSEIDVIWLESIVSLGDGSHNF